MLELSPCSGGSGLPGVRLDRERSPEGAPGRVPQPFQAPVPEESGGEAGAGPGSGGGGAAAPGQGTQALKDVGKTETGGSWGSGGGRPAAGASLLPGQVGWLRSRSFLRKTRRKKKINKRTR